MKYIFYLLSLVIFFTSCSVSNEILTYEKSNASLINKSIQNLNVINKLESYINKNEKIAIVGMEDYKTSDYSLLVTLEDEIIKEFVSNGYTVLERDHDMIYRMFSEEDITYKHISRLKSGDYSFSGSTNGSSIFGSGNGTSIGGSSSFRSSSQQGSFENYNQEYKSNLNSADKLLSYRVIESGIIINYQNEDAELDEVERHARTILEVRLIDAKNSKILAAVTLDGESKDFVNDLDLKALEDFSYKYYSHTLPKEYGNPTKKTVVEKKVGKNTLLVLLSALGLVITLVLA